MRTAQGYLCLGWLKGQVNLNRSVPVSELQVGMYISDVGNDWIPAKRKKRKGYIRSQATIDKIKSLGVLRVCIEFLNEEPAPQENNVAEPKDAKSTEADGESSLPQQGLLAEPEEGKPTEIDGESSLPQQGLLAELKGAKSTEVEGKRHPAAREGIAQRAKKYIPGAVVVPFAEEFERAKSLHSAAKSRVEEAMLLAKIGKPFDIDGIATMANGLIDSIVSNRNTLCMMTVLKSQDNYLYEHSVNCSVLMGIFARHMKLSMDVIHDLVTGAILHDIGMVEVPEDIINKPAKLTPSEEKEMQRHIVLGRKILEKNRGVPAIAFEVCKQHHERLDGQGYMQKMHSHQVNQYGRVGAIVDIYDALTSQRSYRKAFSPAAAMKKLLEMSGGQLDAKLVYQFIQCINIYPVGSLVQLDDSRVGVVHELNVFKKDKPKVRVFYSGKDEQYFAAKTVDLADANIRIKIKKTVDIDDFDIELEDVI